MKEIIRSHITISNEDYALFFNAAKRKESAKNKLLFRPDNTTQKIIFIEEGLLRGYKNLDGKDFT